MKIRFLNGNFIKILAAITMFIDHAGLLLFPNEEILRIIGRISMPLFAMMIAEGCRHTRDRFRHVALISLLGIVYSAVYYFLYEEIYFSILTTFTFSILITYAVQTCKKCIFQRAGVVRCLCSAAILAALLIFVYLLCERYEVDYGFFGCILPVFACLPDMKGIQKGGAFGGSDYYLRLAFFALGLLFCCIDFTWEIKYYALIALLPLLLYNEKRGRFKLKYFFYIFYPAHLILLYLIQFLW